MSKVLRGTLHLVRTYAQVNALPQTHSRQQAKPATNIGAFISQTRAYTAIPLRRKDSLWYLDEMSRRVALKKWHQVRNLYEEMVTKAKLNPNIHHYNTVLASCIGAQDLENGQIIIDTIKHRRVPWTHSTYDLVVQLYLKCGDEALQKRAFDLFDDLKSKKALPAEQTYVEVIDYWCRKGKEDKAREALKEMNDLGVRPNLQAYTAILALSVEKGNLERASIIFKEIKSVGLIPSPTCYNYMIDLCIKNAQQDRINNLLTEMQQMNIPPDSNTFVLFLKARDLETTKRIIKDLKKFKVEPNWEQIIESLIVRQEWDGLRFLMDLVLPHQVPLFNKIIVGCGYARNVDAAIEAYERLISLKMEPTNHTLAVIVDALGCNHRFPLALRYWNEMTDPKGKHRIKPQANAYTSIIEACGSAGQIAKAFDIITQAVHDPHAGVDNKLVRNFLASVLRNNGVEPGPTQWDDFLDPGLLDHKLTKPELHALATALPVWREIVRTHANAIHEARHQHHQHRAEQQHPPSSN